MLQCSIGSRILRQSAEKSQVFTPEPRHSVMPEGAVNGSRTVSILPRMTISSKFQTMIPRQAKA
jgi:hypothetical protein